MNVIKCGSELIGCNLQKTDLAMTEENLFASYFVDKLHENLIENRTLTFKNISSTEKENFRFDF